MHIYNKKPRGTMNTYSSCTNEALSEDYADFIVGSFSSYDRFFNFDNQCISQMTISENTLYAPLDDILPLSIIKYPYSSIPDLYCL